MKQIILTLLLILSTSSYAQKIKVACVGNSITYGAGVENREQNAYPVQLQKMLGDDYDVRNFGHSGATLLCNGHNPYNKLPEYIQALDFYADKVIIHLGVNDTDPRNWPNFQDEFIPNYIQLINDFKSQNPKTEVLICLLTPIRPMHPRFKSGTRDWQWQIQEAIKTIGVISGCKIIDLHTPLYPRPELIPDNIHPNAKGATLIAKAAYEVISGDFGGLSLPILYSDNMVIQQGEPVIINGTANANEKVTVKIDGQKRIITTPYNGEWSAMFDPIKVGKKHTLSISTQSKSVEFNNVVAGEVWLVSGQSNIEYMLSQTDVNEQDSIINSFENNELQNVRVYNMRPEFNINASHFDSLSLAKIYDYKFFGKTAWKTLDNEQQIKNYSAIALHFSKKLSQNIDTPIGLIINAIGGSPAESWVDRKSLEFTMPDILNDWTKNDYIQEWVRTRAFSQMNYKLTDAKHQYEPCYLFDAGIKPLKNYAIAGVLWYQGESNAHNVEAHEIIFKALVNSWRTHYNDATLPFYFVQLSSLNRQSWPQFRNSQRMLAQTIPHCYMAVSSDRGDSLDVHPRRKLDIGNRLAALALENTYKKANITGKSPEFCSLKSTPYKAVITFDNAEGLKTSCGGAPLTFEVSEHKGMFVPAKAKIVGNTVVLECDSVKTIKYVRYGWQPFTRANLVNGANIPASTFQNY